MLVISEPFEAAEKGAADQAPYCLAPGTIQEPLKGLKVEGAYLVVEADQALPALLQGEAHDTCRDPVP